MHATSGAFELELSSADNTITVANKPRERRRGRIEVITTNGKENSKYFQYEVVAEEAFLL